MPFMVHFTCRDALFHSGQGIGHGEAQVVMTMDGKDMIADISDVFKYVAYQLRPNSPGMA